VLSSHFDASKLHSHDFQPCIMFTIPKNTSSNLHLLHHCQDYMFKSSFIHYFQTIPKSRLSNLRHFHHSQIKAVILPLIYVTLLILSRSINTSKLASKMDFFFIIIKIQDTKHLSNSLRAKLHLLHCIKTLSPTTIEFLALAREETLHYNTVNKSWFEQNFPFTAP
jgi:hypothetical protein